MHQSKGLIDEEFDSMKLEIIIDENKKEEYYFSDNSYNNDENYINFRPKKSNTVKDLIIQVIRNKRSSTIEFLRNPSLYNQSSEEQRNKLSNNIPQNQNNNFSSLILKLKINNENYENFEVNLNENPILFKGRADGGLGPKFKHIKSEMLGL